MNISKFRNRVKEIRTKKGQTLREFAESLGFSASYISKIENGKVNPSITSIEKIARKLNIPMSHFF
ncbi:helix-turn-helix domain-containing protein [Bacillus vallismortis]|uniref:helix-turn-helix domain-containing protein n=1 Tax=Bacillus vallismortis TaxID=72361 RepID=UPI0020900931|nr:MULTISPECIES: helix-turn-helix transcriptional regulator [Bacillus subtilis group]MCO4849934.1 helix-turn-helix transcriptional regulator [Bacillus vallismortis]MCY8310735.1 helix-turn-helix transcriptional regulator [Bacillus vallismortis]MDM5301868.1 helix-turn-helix transcriptional regulator [Bacillus subtilis]MDM5323921.1 helix-turn-helix transcriptional regulator [Bacillus subtilis]MEC1650130.1 helix-turn-helix transcriptional regulator [Bacillus vallismortis]